MSREVARLARTNRLLPLIVYDVAKSSPSHLYLSIIPVSLPFFLYPSPECLWEVYDLSRAVLRSVPQRAEGGILLLPMCQTHHLLCFSAACSGIPGLNNPPGVAVFTLPHRHFHLPPYLMAGCNRIPPPPKSVHIRTDSFSITSCEISFH